MQERYGIVQTDTDVSWLKLQIPGTLQKCSQPGGRDSPRGHKLNLSHETINKMLKKKHFGLKIIQFQFLQETYWLLLKQIQLQHTVVMYIVYLCVY